MVDLIVPSLFLGSLLVPYVVLLFFRYAVPKRSGYYSYINEFLCTALWLCWCFELKAMNHYIESGLAVNAVAFAILTVQPMVYEEAFGNPCVVMVEYLKGLVPIAVAVRFLLLQLLAVPITIVTVYTAWFALSPLSLSHYHMLYEIQPNYLFSSKLVGALCEALVTFIAFVPVRFISPGFHLNVINSTYFVIIGQVIGPFTGAFFNPLPITAFSLFYYKQTWAELALVYWCGSAMGGILAFLALYRGQVIKSKIS